MVEVEVLDILARDDIYLAVPVVVEVVECSELLFLLVAEVWEILCYAFHYFIISFNVL